MIKLNPLKPVYSIASILAVTAIALVCSCKTSVSANSSPITPASSPLVKQAKPNRVFSAAQSQILLSAVRDEDLNLVKLALSRNADPNTSIQEGKEGDGVKGTPVLQIAAEQNSLEIAKVLIDAGANVNGNQVYIYVIGSPLITAADRGHLEIAQLLILKGAKIDLSADGGYTALDAAITRNRYNVAEMLLVAGFKPNYYTEGVTPLYHAASLGYANIVRLLLQHGADPNFGNSFAKPLAIAIQKSHLEVVNILKAAGAK